MTEYRAFDKKGALVSHEDLTEADAGVAWGVQAVLEGAALFERKDGDNWVCLFEYLSTKPQS